ncbi:pentatricopeptide repeat-containing protein [Planoprotostelium fungivorum]|uniref:Pentatricopeptide repeat-containing protein n=1 Tax=Planoprotostelium fungivorum TaxID=1890364 RepID=A0A2P6NDU8_9EUKA|nr:pentatricopeptide repeat-containing protein [Planoprotostelium fungivorum]
MRRADSFSIQAGPHPETKRLQFGHFRIGFNCSYKDTEEEHEPALVTSHRPFIRAIRVRGIFHAFFSDAKKNTSNIKISNVHRIHQRPLTIPRLTPFFNHRSIGYTVHRQQYLKRITVAAQSHNMQGVLQVLKDMQDDQITPDIFIYGSTMHAFLRADDPRSTILVWKLLRQSKLTLNFFVYNLLLDAMSRIPNTAERMYAVWEEMKETKIEPNVKTFQTLHNALFKEKQYELAEKVWTDMRARDLTPDSHMCQNALHWFKITDMEKYKQLMDEASKGDWKVAEDKASTKIYVSSSHLMLLDDGRQWKDVPGENRQRVQRTKHHRQPMGESRSLP